MGSLPKDYQPPKSQGAYTKFEIGSTKIRVLSDVLTGYETWVDVDGKRKPVRARDLNDLPMSEDQPKHFWVFVGWNYKVNQIQICEITQKSIQNTLYECVKNEDYGADLTKYDFTVTKTGEGKDTRYSVMPSPPKPISKEIQAEYLKRSINLEALFTGGNPFEGDESNTRMPEPKDSEYIDPSTLPF